MPRRTRLPHASHHVSVYDCDWELLMQMFGKQGRHPVGVSELIREIIHEKCGHFRAQYQGARDASRGRPPDTSHQTPDEESV